MQNIPQKLIAYLVNATNFPSRHFDTSGDWRRRVRIQVFPDYIKLITQNAVTALNIAHWTLELDPAIPNRVILRHIPTNTPTFFRVNPWTTLSLLAELSPKHCKQLPPPPPTTDFILITPHIFD